MANIESTHYRVTIEMTNFEGVAVLYLNKEDTRTQENITQLEILNGCTIGRVTVKEPQDPLLVQWRNNVQGGNTLLSFQQWKDQHHG